MRFKFHFSALTAMVSAGGCDTFFFIQQAPVQTRGRTEEQTEEEERARRREFKESKKDRTADKF